MCLSTVYTVQGEEKQLLCKNIAAVKTDGDRLVFTDIMGIPTVVSASIERIDFMDNFIYIRQQ